MNYNLILTHKDFILPFSLDTLEFNDFKVIRCEKSTFVKNKYYAEISGLIQFYIDNKDKIEDNDVISTSSYRRYHLIINENRFANSFDYDNFLEKYDIVVNVKECPYKEYPYTALELYGINEGNQNGLNDGGRSIDLVQCRDIIRDKYPDMMTAVDNVLMSTDGLHYRNMFAMKGDLFKEYMEFLIDILLTFEKEHIDRILTYPKAAARVMGYLAEYLLNFFIGYKQLNKKELNFYNTEWEQINL